MAGHSLGGGLASAAAIVGGFNADTFNAAGLQRSTLATIDSLADYINGIIGEYVENYAGSFARYDNAAQLIDAYYSTWDILSFLQDFTPMQNAIGSRWRIDGPHDGTIAVSVAAVAASTTFAGPWGVFIGQSILAGDVAAMMIDSHRMWSVLYGMLVESDTGFIVEIDTYGL